MAKANKTCTHGNHRRIEVVNGSVVKCGAPATHHGRGIGTVTLRLCPRHAAGWAHTVGVANVEVA